MVGIEGNFLFLHFMKEKSFLIGIIKNFDFIDCAEITGKSFVSGKKQTMVFIPAARDKFSSLKNLGF